MIAIELAEKWAYLGVFVGLVVGLPAGAALGLLARWEPQPSPAPVQRRGAP